MAENLAIPGDLDWAAWSRYTGVKYGAVGRGDVSLVQISLEAPADFISQPRSLVLDGCPMFAPAYMGRKRIFQMLSLHARGFLLLAVVCFARVASSPTPGNSTGNPGVRSSEGHPSREAGLVVCSLISVVVCGLAVAGIAWLNIATTRRTKALTP
jgi:hypothetical protein